MSQSHCVRAIRNLAAGNIADAHFFVGCTVEEASGALLGLAYARDTPGALGTDRVQMYWRTTSADVAGERLLLWHDKHNVLAVELEAPHPINDWRQAIVPPEFKLAFWNDVIETIDGQWVYPSRGLALFVSNDTLVRVMIFPPTTITEYLMKLARGTEPPREFEDK